MQKLVRRHADTPAVRFCRFFMVLLTQKKIEPSMSSKVEVQPSSGHHTVSISDDTLAIVPAKKRENSTDTLIPTGTGMSATVQDKKDPHVGGLSREAADALVKKSEQKLIAREAESAAILRYVIAIASHGRPPLVFYPCIHAKLHEEIDITQTV